MSRLIGRTVGQLRLFVKLFTFIFLSIEKGAVWFLDFTGQRSHLLVCIFLSYVFGQVEMERALLEGEQQIQMEQLDRIKEKIISLERKEANLLAEAASQRAKVCQCHIDYS